MSAAPVGVRAVDLGFQGVAGVIAAYALPSAEGPVLVDPGPASTLGALRSGLAALGLNLADVRHVLLTHVHLDHAGAAGVIARETGATVYAHARGAPHLARPERLLASAGQIYGEFMDALWGEMLPVPEAQLRPLGGGEVLELGGRRVEAIASPGHAVHHLAYLAHDDLLCGDVAGIRLTPAMSPRAPTPPPDIDLEAWRESVARLRATNARRLHLTHFGSHDDPQAHWDALLANMDVDAERVRAGLAAGEELEALTEAFTAAQGADLACEEAGLDDRMRFASPAWMSVQGLARYWQKKARRAAPASGNAAGGAA